MLLLLARRNDLRGSRRRTAEVSVRRGPTSVQVLPPLRAVSGRVARVHTTLPATRRRLRESRSSRNRRRKQNRRQEKTPLHWYSPVHTCQDSGRSDKYIYYIYLLINCRSNCGMH